ncbi:hypothetical protein C8Q74DRAFT_1369974 [Fomes fomentarius]|nr:hypothetical protein C8Q74DRAFT_1369974 [Fomes fomentarius]
MSLHSVLCLLSVIVWTWQTSAQGTAAVCNSTYEWMSNSKGQSPCLISSYLFTPCDSPEDSYVHALPQGFHYASPAKDPTSANPCRCNTVIFSTLAACATCQGGAAFVRPWLEYSINCSIVNPQEYPESIPSGTAVPAWAYLDVIASSTFDPDAALEVAKKDLPESTGFRAPSSTSTTASVSPSDTTASSSTPQITIVSDSSSSSKMPDVKAIVGGVVGAVLGLNALGIAAFLYLRFRGSSKDTSAGSLDTAVHHTAGDYLPQVGYQDKSLLDRDPHPHLLSNDSATFYDPNNPSTFPSSGGAHAGGLGGRSHDIASNFYGHLFSGPHASLGKKQITTYTGAAEVQP